MKVMKIAVAVTTVMLLTSNCGTYTAEGAYAGGSFGSVLGSAIGGIAGGWRGSDIGTVVGMAGGAAIGAAVGAAADKKQAEQVEQYKRERAERMSRRNGTSGPDGEYRDGTTVDDSGFDATNSADDRIDFDGAGPRGHSQPDTSADRDNRARGTTRPADRVALEIRNASVVDADHDGVLRPGEECKITFEVMNRSRETVYDVQPLVSEVTGNKRIHISPNLHVESIAPHQGIRYTATLLADRRLKDGTAVVRVGVAAGQQFAPSQEFSIPTRKR